MINNFTSKLILLLACMAWAGTSVWAQADDGNLFIVDGIYYKQIAQGGEQYVYVIENPLKYKGDIVVPDWVTYDGTRYKVLGIGDGSFKDCTELTSISFEGKMAFIGNYAFENCTGLQDFTCPTTYWYWSGNQIGYRAFYGCHFKTFTITNTSAPGYDTKNPSYTGGISYTSPDWFEKYWMDGHYSVSLSQYTTLYVPAGHGLEYMVESSSSNLQQWQSYHFSKIKEWGTEEWDNAMEFMYDTIPGLWQAFDDIVLEGMVRDMTDHAIAVLDVYVDSLARAEGIEPDFTLVQNAFEVVDYSHRGAESLRTYIFPTIKPMIDDIYKCLNLAEENFIWLSVLRREYYDVKREYEREYESEYQDYMDEYNSIDWENLSDEELAESKEAFDYWKEDLEAWQEEMQKDLAQRRDGISNMYEEMQTPAFEAGSTMEAILSSSNDVFEKAMWDFINEFKAKIADGIHSVHDDVNTTVSSCYSLSGERLAAPRKGVNIMRDSKGVTRKVLVK